LAIAGDLDGDLFFVTWDPDLIPDSSALQPPADYTGTAERPEGPVTPESLIRYFAHHSNAMLGRLNGAYLAWANLRGTVNCAECRQLSALFARGVDSVKTGERLTLPPHLAPSDEQRARAQGLGKQRIWGRLLEKAEEERVKAQRTVVREGDPAPLSEDSIWGLINGQDLCLSEWELFRIVERWCAVNGRPQAELAERLDFGKFSAAQVGL
jgi:hypothetical protein